MHRGEGNGGNQYRHTYLPGHYVLGTQLESLCKAVDPQVCEIIVADNGSIDNTAAVAQSFVNDCQSG